jgi:hypothetical protein
MQQMDVIGQTSKAAVQSNNWLARPLSTLLNVYSNITTTRSDDPWELQLLYGLRVFKPAGINSKVAYDCSVNPIVIQNDAAAAPAAVDCSILSALQKFGAFLSKVVVSCSRTTYKDTVAYNPDSDGFIQHKIDHQTPLSALLYGMATGEENPVDKEMVRNPITDYLNQSNSSKSLARTYQSRFFLRTICCCVAPQTNRATFNSCLANSCRWCHCRGGSNGCSPSRK